jgi:hypothetical protein
VFWIPHAKEQRKNFLLGETASFDMALGQLNVPDLKEAIHLLLIAQR